MADTEDLTISPALQAELRAAAATAQRPANDIVREALETYLARHRSNPHPVPDASRRKEAAARMLEQRKGRVLPAGMTIENMIAYGRK